MTRPFTKILRRVLAKLVLPELHDILITLCSHLLWNLVNWRKFRADILWVFIFRMPGVEGAEGLVAATSAIIRQEEAVALFSAWRSIMLFWEEIHLFNLLNTHSVLNWVIFNCLTPWRPVVLIDPFRAHQSYPISILDIAGLIRWKIVDWCRVDGIIVDVLRALLMAI